MKSYFKVLAAAAILLLCFLGLLRLNSIYSRPCYKIASSSPKMEVDRKTLPQYHSSGTVYKRKAIVVFAHMRTGSTFLGEYFNYHSEIYYLYDPLQGAGLRDEDAPLRQKILLDLLRCNYSRIPDYYGDMTNKRMNPCRSGICFPEKLKFLRRNSHLCDINRPRQCSEHLDPKALERVCKQSMLTTVKEIAMRSLSELEPILADESLDVKVIQLIRDPRPVVPSQLKMTPKEPNYSGASGAAESLCLRYSNNMEYTERCILGKTSDTPTETCDKEIQKRWKGRFIRISHEYVSEDPLRALELIYNFAGLNYDENVAEWIKQNTAVKPGTRKSDPTKQKYGTTRDSKAVISEWRNREKYEHIEAIQKPCSDAMKRLGYVPVNSENEMKNLTLVLYDTKKHLIIPP